MVDILGRAGLIDEAKNLITRMQIEPNIVLLESLLGVCKLQGFTNVGDYVARHLQNLAPGDRWCYVLISNIYADEYQWDEVVEMRKLMKQKGIEKKTPGCSSIEVNSVVHEFVVDDKLHLNWREVYSTIDRLSTHLEVERITPLQDNISPMHSQAGFLDNIITGVGNRRGQNKSQHLKCLSTQNQIKSLV